MYNKNYNRNRLWNKRKKSCEPIHISSLPFARIKKDERLLFLANIEEYNIHEVSKWSDNFSKVYPDVKYVIFPDNMFTSITRLTGKEYTVINNILKRCMEEIKDKDKENSIETK